jgi:translation elongation factor EF-1alpha
MTTEQWYSSASLDETIKAAVEHQETEQEGKKLPVTCINDFADILLLYVTSGELTPGEFMRCFTLAVEAELKQQQQQTMDALTDVLELLGE